MPPSSSGSKNNLRELGLFFVIENGDEIFTETSVVSQRTTWHYIPEGRNLRTNLLATGLQ
jgi:hypothetical protein